MQLKENNTIIKIQESVYLWEEGMGDNYRERVRKRISGMLAIS